MPRMFTPLLAVLCLSWGVSEARAEDTPAEDTPSEEVSAEGSVTGTKLPPLELKPHSPASDYKVPTMTTEEYAKLDYPIESYRGAEQLHMEPAFVNGIREGLELMYQRKYNEARDHFDTLEETYPKTGLAAVMDTLIWQALMLENFDFKYDKQYWTSTKLAKSEVEAALKVEGNEAWEHLLMASLVGIESIHTMRRSKYMSALTLAFQAMEEVEKCRTAAPDFLDLTLADGMYNYWRTVVTMSSDVLPDFGDNRAEGIQQMEVVKQQGVFVKPLARLAMAYTWIEEGKLHEAMKECLRNQRDYPDSVVNNMVLATVFIYKRQYEEALKVLAKVESADPKNQRMHYWKGLALLRSGQLEEAQGEFSTYLGGEFLEDYQRSWTNYRLGQVYAKQKNHTAAYEAFKEAHRIDGHKAAKKAMDRMKKRKKEGKIKF